MKITSKRALSILLVLVLVFGLSVPAFAADAKYMDFDGIYTLGDSNAMAYGMNGYKGGQVDEKGTLIPGTEFTDLSYLHCVPGSFQDVVREGLGLPFEKAWSMNYPALRIRDALYYLDACDADEYHELAYSYRVVNVERDAAQDPTLWDPEGTIWDNSESVFIDRLQEFEHPLIINQLCSADIFYSLLELALAKVAEVGTDDVADVIKGVVSVFWEKHAEFRQDYPMLIERLQELSPNGVIVLVGMFNPMKDLTATDDTVLPVFNALQPLFDLINADIEGFAKEYGCLYADVSNTETLTITNDVSVEAVLSGFDVEKVYHATPEGYAYMGRQVLRQVELDNDKPITYIDLDLGPVKSVSSVMIDGKTITNYTYDEENRELIVPWNNTMANTLTVTEQREDGSVYVAVYALRWTAKDGYIARELYVTLDAAKTAQKAAKTASKVAASIFKSVGTVTSSILKSTADTLISGIGKLFRF